MKDASQSGHISVATTPARPERPAAKVPVANNNCSRTSNNNTGLSGHGIGKSVTRDKNAATRDSSVDDEDDSDEWDFGIRNLVIDLDADLDVRGSSVCADSVDNTSAATAENRGNKADDSNKMSGVEHHSSVDRGLKMKIKRKNVASGGKSCDSKPDTIKDNNKSQQGGGSNTWNNSASNGNNTIDRGGGSSTPDKQSERLKQASQSNSSFAQADAKLAKARVMHKRERVKDKSARGAGENCHATNGECDSGCSSSGSSSAVSVGGATECVEEVDSVGVKKEQDAKSLSDPYEFNAKVEDRIGLPVKKVKGEKVETTEKGANCGTETHSVGVGTNSVAVATDPDCLGPCEPGTHVMLEGIVWNETENGVLVVNVTWRGKTYMGTLMDSTKHTWAPPGRRLNCESPISDLESRTPKGRGKRGRGVPINQQPVAEVGDRKLRKTRRNNMGGHTTPSSPDVTSGSNGGAAAGKRKGRPSDLELDNKSSKRVRCSMRTAVNVARDPSPDLIVCPEPNCNKKYRHLNGLKYHQTHAHQEPSSPRSEATADGPMDTTEAKSSGSTKSGDRFDDVDKDEKVSTTGKGRGKTQSPRKVVTPSGSVKEPTNSSGASSQSRCEKDDSKVVAPPVEEKARECATASGFKDSVPSIMAGSKPVLAVHSCVPSLVAATCAGPVTIVTQIVSTTSANLVSTSSTVVSAANAVIPASATTTVIATVPVVTATVASSKDAGDRLKRCKVEKTATKVATVVMAAKSKSVIATRPLLPAPPVGGAFGAVSVHAPVSHAGFTATSQLKPIQPKPTIMGETTNVKFALTSLKELKEKKSKKKRNKERPRDAPTTSDSKPEAVTRTDEPLMSVIKPVPSPLVGMATGDSTNVSVIGDVRPVVSVVSADLPKPEATVESLSQDKVDLTSSVVGKTPEPCVRSASVQPPNTLSIISPLEVLTTDVRERDSTVQSPAYSDISDANDSAPTLENEVEAKPGSAGDVCKVSCDQSLDQCVQSSYGICQPFYGQPPYLVPAVSQDAIHAGSGGGGSRQSTPKPNDKDGSRSKSGSPRVGGDSEERTDASGRCGDRKLAGEQQREKTMQQSQMFSQYHPYMMSGNGGAVGYSNYHMPVMSNSPQYKEQQQRRQEASAGQSQSPHHRKEPTSTQSKPDKKPDTDVGTGSRVDTVSRTPVRSPAPKTAIPAVAPSGHAGSPVLVSSSSRGQVEKARAQEPKRAPSSESLKKKQNENHQIMKENIELKHQMPSSRGGGSVRGQQTYEPQASPANAGYEPQASPANAGGGSVRGQQTYEPQASPANAGYEPQASPANAGYEPQASPANAGYDAQFLMELQHQDVQRFYMFQQQRMLEQQRYNEMMAADGDGGAEKCTAKDLSKPKVAPPSRDGGDVERAPQNRTPAGESSLEAAAAAVRHKNEVRARENKSASPLNMAKAKPVSGGGVMLSGGGLPGSAPQYYGHPYQYAGQVPFDPARGMYPGMGPYVGYAANPMGYGVHPAAMRYHVTPMEGAVDESMMLSPNVPGMSDADKALDLLQQHASHYYNAVPGPHKIHELKDAAKPAPGKLTPPLSSSSAKEVERPGSANSATSPKDMNGSPLLQRHLHTHHHTHVVGPPGYPMYGS